MNLSEVFIRRPVMTVALTVSVILFGVLAYFRLPVSDLPAVDYPVIQVQVNYPGATPDTMANNVATPLERQFMQIPGLELVTSNNGQGHSSFVLQFDLSKSLDGAATDVQAAITRAQGQLPVDLPSPPTFTKTNPNDQPIQYIALVSDTVTEGELYDYANTQVGERLSILPGVSQIAVYGTQSAVRIKADPSAMAIRNITLEDLTGAIKNGTAYTGAGQFDGPHRSFLLQPQGQLTTAEDYNDLIVGQSGGAPVYLKDVASARQSVQDERIDMRFWVRGYPQPGATVVVAVFRRAGANAVEVAKSVRGSASHNSITASYFCFVGVGIRPIPDHCGQHKRCAVHAVYRIRAGGHGHFRFSWPGHRHSDSCRGAAPVVVADLHRHEHTWLQPGQSFADGTHARHRVSGRRCDRISGKYGAADGAGTKRI